MAASPPPGSVLPCQVPAHRAFHIDLQARVLRISYRGQFGVTDSVLDLPLCIVKQLGGNVALLEGQLEQKSVTN